MTIGGLQRHRAGMVLGTFFAALHALWATGVYLGVADAVLNFVLRSHFVAVQHATFRPTLLWLASGLVTAFAAGYIAGTVLAFLWNRSYDYF